MKNFALQRIQPKPLRHNIFRGNQLPLRYLATELRQKHRALRFRMEFPLFSQRVLIALDTGQGVVYAPASGWDRVYLLWTFRNFRSLPQNVLSPRQQQLIGSLYRGSSNYRPHELRHAVVVGTVEEFRPSSLATRSSSFKAGRLVPDAPAAKSASFHVPGLTPFYARFANRVTLRVGTAALVVAIAILAWHQLGAEPVGRFNIPTGSSRAAD
jgi:hypothetical protein